MESTVRFHELARLSAAERAALMLRTEAELGGFIDSVRPVIEAVRTEGDEAVARPGAQRCPTAEGR